ncbi:transglycosylase domain-containing protein [Cohnella nanjingensis]|uniref:PBP1A family penicillin-binding protein n=1 Tax=Cohnella nanjingensis TaxID=1387779 RepID=A0A7X0RKI1_9BACL|nr:PBP1A family penicillin-binding protein [Cohnella nanjingensis]MBB6669152.1 PBP1A family penicillin-binding protein [Cohnella nanjingensis]
MASTANASKGKDKRSKAPKRKNRKRVALIWLFFVVLFAIVCAVVGYLLVILNGERILAANENKLNNMDRATVIADASGKEITKLFVAEGNREYIHFKDIPKKVQDAFIATEDKRFYEHGGVDFWGIGRALAKDVVARSMVEGASTITQQLARNLFLSSDKTWFRKGTEASIALALENHKSKEEILELYLNRIYFGKRQYGIKTAAKYYFNVDDLNKLELWQIATLAAIPKGPNIYNPVKDPEKSKERRGVILKLMEDQGLITEAERQQAAAVDYDPSVVPKQQSGRFAAFTDYVVDEAQDVMGLTEEELLSGGYTIYTTIDIPAQEAMESAFAKDSNFEKSKDETPIQGAMVIMDQHDGSLKAMVGGRDYERNGWNRATKGRQPGSSFKPIVSYGPAIESGDYFPWSTLRDDKICYDNGKYCPTDSNGKKYIGAVSMKEAIRESRNQPAVWLLNQIGVSTGIKFADKLGITLDKGDRNLAIALGGLTKGVTPIQMARAYGTFANGGQLQDSHSILKIENVSKEPVYTFKDTKAKQVIKDTTAYYVTDILKGVVASGTGTKAQIKGRTVAGKTGTTQLGIPGVKSSGNRDVWFVGYTPEWTAAVWMGYDKTDKDHYVQKSSGQAAALFSQVMSKALAGHEKLSFPEPKAVEQAKPPEGIKDLSGMYDSQQVSINLNWSAVEGEEITYKIYRKADGESQFSLRGESVTPSFEDLAILPDMTYTYYVRSYQASTKTEGSDSNQVSVTVTTGLDEQTPPPEEQTPPPEEQTPPPEEQTPPPVESTPPPVESTPTPTPTPPVSPGESTPTMQP